MNLRIKIIIVLLILTIPSLLIGHLTMSQLSKIAKPISQEIPQYTQQLTKASELSNLSQLIRYYDEVLTQAARNYAFTKDEKWKEIYIQSAPKLDEVIKEAINFGDNIDKKYFQEIDAANIALVKMEEDSMNLIGEDKQPEAIKILEGEEYWKQKEIYKLGLNKFVERRGTEYNQALTTSTKTLETVTKQTQELIKSSTETIIIAVIISIIIAILLGIIIAYLITKPLTLLKKNVLEITQGDLQKRVDIKSNDEIGQLADAFNKMTDKVQQAQTSIEVKVTQRTAELEKTNKFMVGREIKMIELKKQLQQVKEQLNKNK